MKTDPGYMKPSQLSALRQDLRVAEDALTNPEIEPYIEDKAQARKHVRNLKQAIDRYAPKPFDSPLEKDAAFARERELREDITTGMLSVEEMRRNRQGTSDSVTRHQRWEKANKAKIVEWKSLRHRLEPDSDDPDLCNLEMYRPSKPLVYDSTSQIAGHHAMSPAAKANWPEEMAEPKAKTAISHLKETYQGVADKIKRAVTREEIGEEAKAIMAKLKQEPADGEKDD